MGNPSLTESTSGPDNFTRDDIPYPIAIRTMSDPRPNPPRRSVLAVWRWPWQTWIVMVPLLMASYVLSQAPMAFALFSAGIYRHGAVNAIYRIVYWPLFVLCDAWPPFREVFVWEWTILANLFGDPR